MDHAIETGVELFSPTVDGTEAFLLAIFESDEGQQILDDVTFTF